MRRFFLLLLLIITRPGTAFGHADDYLDETFVFRTLDRGVMVPENWFDLRRSPRGQNYFRDTLSIEYGVTDQFMFSATLALDRARAGFNYSRSRFEARYRFGEENPRGISVAVSSDIEDDQLDRSAHLRPRLVLNRDFEDFNITLNLFPQFTLRGHENISAGYGLGLRYGQKQVVRYGLELKQTFGGAAFGQIIPQISIRLPREFDSKIGYAQGLTDHSDSFFRVIIEREF